MDHNRTALEWVRLEHPHENTEDAAPRDGGAEDEWVRVSAEATGVYVWPGKPSWCVPDRRGDFIFKRLLAGEQPQEIATLYARRFAVSDRQAMVDAARFARRIEHPAAPPYEGRAAHLSLDRLRECWLHVTNRCNARCRHCMFCSSPAEGDHLSTDQALDAVRQALDLGCELFYFTGGEPFMHDGFLDVIRWIDRNTDAHQVILTNAIAAPSFLLEMRGLDRERTHFQVSVDGAAPNHDAVRGAGSYAMLVRNLERMTAARFPVTLAMAAHRGNLEDMANVVRLAARLGVGNVHYLWLFVRGHAEEDLYARPADIFPELVRAASVAEREGVLIDNLEILRAQVFSIPGSRFDLSNAGWQSLAVGPRGGVYPSPALVGEARARAGAVGQGLEDIWRGSPVLQELRHATLADSAVYRENPLRFIIGGGDVDHSMLRGGEWVGHDPYVPLYNRVALDLIVRESERFEEPPRPGFRLRMGDKLETCAEGDGVFCTHSNCVLSVADLDGHSLARDFYTRAAEEPNEEILNPSRYDEADIEHVPDDARTRSYGCGSPVADAGLRPGETVVDLGCGAGMECFVAARQVGPKGRVIGVDMLPAMLDRARASANSVVRELGYDNLEFRHGMLENLPLEDGSVDVIISNCVINLCPEKRRVFAEIRRVLQPGGHLVIADVASADEIPIDIQYNEKLRGECLGGAFQQQRLFELLADVGFGQVTMLKRVPYRRVQGHAFYSLTYRAVRPDPAARRRAVYRGPFAAVIADDGTVMERGQEAAIPWQEDGPLDPGVFVLDEEGNVTNVAQELTCSCAMPPEKAAEADDCCCEPTGAADEAGPQVRRDVDCMVCGAPLEYLPEDRDAQCHYCGRTRTANARCAEGHYVCDDCHSSDALEVIENICRESTETDMLALFARLRRHRAVPVHGPEHHSIVPAVIVAAYRNSGGDVPDVRIRMAVQRGATIGGGACAFLGACGAATGVGTGFALLLGANPYKGPQRRIVMQAAGRVLQDLARYEAARCCQRDCWIGLRVAAEASEELLDIPLRAEAGVVCDQRHLNRECLGPQCPLWPES
jgi:MoaA/NifB/PqqE/SkfB family radical SAM enzyme/SAM-dependent methyltransferase